MADFKTHTILGTGVGIGVSCLAVTGNFITLSGSVLAVFLSAVASALPDIDSDSGSPRKFALSALEILCPAILMVSFSKDFSLENLMLSGIAVFFVIRYPLGYLIDKATKHRGAWHSIPMALIASMIVYLVFYRSAFSSRIFFALIFFVCFLSHLILDEICSLKYFGLSVKKSFGTALKFSGSSWLQTVFMYIVIVILGGICLFEQVAGGK